jgi:hypothetical protein
MKQADWKKLCKNIYEQNTILVLGAEFPIEIVRGNHPTTFAQLLAARIIKELKSIKTLPDNIVNHLDSKDYLQLVTDYLNYKHIDPTLGREDLECLLKDYLTQLLPKIKSEYFQKLMSLPFTTVVHTNYTTFFQDQLQQAGRLSTSEYFNFRKPEEGGARLQAVELNRPGLKTHVFNLFGSIDEGSSLVLSESDLIDFALGIISKNPDLPVSIKNQLADPQKSLLFLGVSFITKSWYFRMLLHALESHRKTKMSYAVLCSNDQRKYDKLTAQVLKDELKVTLCDITQKDFIRILLDHYNKYIGKATMPGLTPSLPTVFVSYKSEDFKKVQEVCQRLKLHGIDTWIDKERLQGNWKEKIAEQIKQSDAFLLIQSQQLRTSPISYVNVEIKEALKRSKYYQSEADFIFPGCIDPNTGDFVTHPDLSEINFYDLTKTNKIDQLAKDIKASYQKNMIKKAA